MPRVAISRVPRLHDFHNLAPLPPTRPALHDIGVKMEELERRLSADPEGPGIFAATTFVQRVNTVGGKAPAMPGNVMGQVARVPYAADYFFFREAND